MSHVLPAAYAADVDRCRQVSYQLLKQQTGVLQAAYATYRCLTSCLRNIQVSYQLLTQHTGVLPAAYATGPPHRAACAAAPSGLLPHSHEAALSPSWPHLQSATPPWCCQLHLHHQKTQVQSLLNHDWWKLQLLRRCCAGSGLISRMHRHDAKLKLMSHLRQGRWCK